MSTYYVFYAEKYNLTNKQWECICPYFPSLDAEGYEITPLIVGQSYLAELYQFMTEYSRSRADFSEAIAKKLEDRDDAYATVYAEGLRLLAEGKDEDYQDKETISVAKEILNTVSVLENLYRENHWRDDYLPCVRIVAYFE